MQGMKLSVTNSETELSQHILIFDAMNESVRLPMTAHTPIKMH